MAAINYRFSIGDEVALVEIGRPGRVIGLLTDKEGNQYNVSYWYEGKRYVEWLFDWEIRRSDK